MADKHPERRKHIAPDIFTLIPEEEVSLKVGKILENSVTRQ